MPVKLVADENFQTAIVRGLLKRQPELDVVRVQDVGLCGVEDPEILEWASRQQRVLLTHDFNTVIEFAYNRLIAGQPMPGVIEVRQSASIGQSIKDILLLTEFEEECRGQVRYVPL